MAGMPRLAASWGEPGAPIVPQSLRELWRGRFVMRGFTFDELGSEIWTRLSHEECTRMLGLVAHAVAVSAAEDDFRRTRVFVQGWPSELDPRQVPFKTRSANCLRSQGLLKDTDRLGSLTYGELLQVRNCGANTMLDIASTGEAAIEDAGYLAVSGTETELTTEERQALLSLSQQEWAKRASGSDPRIVEVIGEGATSFAVRAEVALNSKSPMFGRRLLKVAGEAKSRLDEDDSRPLDLILGDLVRLVLKQERPARALIGRLGWDGYKPLTLAEAGLVAGVTRERVRQIETKLMAALAGPAYVPQLQRALDLLEAESPVTTSSAGRLLAQQGISRGPLHPSGILKAAELFHYSTELAIEKTTGGEVVSIRGNRHAAKGLDVVVKHLGKPFPIFSSAAVSAEMPDSVDEHHVDRWLESRGGLRLVGGWWWYPVKRASDPLFRLVADMLSVAGGSLSVDELRGGVTRRLKFREGPSLIPSDVLLAFCRSHGQLVVDGDRVTTPSVRDWQAHLGNTDRILVEVLLRAPNHVLDRSAFREESLRRGMNPNTFSVYTTYSPFIKKLGAGLWTIRGHNPDPVVVESLLRSLDGPRYRQVLDYSWTDTGELRLLIELHSVESIVVGIPSGVRRYVSDRSFNVYGPTGQQVATVKVGADGASWGYGPFLSRSGAEVGDYLSVEFDLLSGSASLQVLTENDSDDMDDS